MSTSLKIGFMGTPDFALTALQALHEGPHEVTVAYSQPPRPKGRGHKVQPSPVHAYAEAQGIPVLTPKGLKSQEALDAFVSHDLDVAIVAAYGLILPKAILDVPRYGCLNIHASLLPRWRGASPIQQAIWKGDEETGISIMQMDEGLDTGPVIEVRALNITKETTASTLHNALADLGGQMVSDVLDQLSQDKTLPAQAQDNDHVTYAPLLKKKDGQIDWSQNAQAIDRQIRALNPWPGVVTNVDGKRVKILEAALDAEPTTEPPGTILGKDGRVSCADGSTLRLIKIQPHGSKAMDFVSALNGGHIRLGDVFS